YVSFRSSDPWRAKSKPCRHAGEQKNDDGQDQASWHACPCVSGMDQCVIEPYPPRDQQYHRVESNAGSTSTLTEKVDDREDQGDTCKQQPPCNEPGREVDPLNFK